jgi:hypothetical protein
MIVPSRFRRLRKTVLSALAAAVLTAGALIAMPGTSQAAGTLPCDIYGAAGTPCVAAHSTTRALFGADNGSLYQVRHAPKLPSANGRSVASHCRTWAPGTVRRY